MHWMSRSMRRAHLCPAARGAHIATNRCPIATYEYGTLEDNEDVVPARPLDGEGAGAREWRARSELARCPCGDVKGKSGKR